ncbi:MAG: hypothetical protein ACKOET_13860 [Verrucomicrobiota bacterium]
MRGVISLSEIVTTLEGPAGPEEVVATAEGSYDDTHRQVAVQLEAFLRPVDLVHAEQHLAAGWLPAAQTAREGVDREEASSLARDLFHRWVRKVREAVAAHEEERRNAG